MLLKCADARHRGANSQAIQSLVEDGIDWDHLDSMAYDLGMTPMLFWRLSVVCPELVPGEPFARWRRHFRENGLRNMQMVHELTQLQELFGSHGIQAVPVKGPEMSACLYKHIALRWYRDLDILFRKRDLPDVSRLLSERGYRLEDDLTERLLRDDCELHFRHEQTGLEVEAHWRFFPKHSVGGASLSDEVWDRLASVAIGDREMPALEPEDLFTYLCLHAGQKHSWDRLRQFSDLSAMVEAYPDMDWDRIAARTAGPKNHETLEVALWLVHSLLGAPLPEAVLRSDQVSTSVRGRASLAWGRMFREGHGLPGFDEWLQYVEWQRPPNDRVVRTMSRLRMYAHYIRAVLRPEFGDRLNLHPAIRRCGLAQSLIRICRLVGKHRTDLLSRVH